MWIQRHNIVSMQPSRSPLGVFVSCSCLQSINKKAFSSVVEIKVSMSCRFPFGAHRMSLRSVKRLFLSCIDIIVDLFPNFSALRLSCSLELLVTPTQMVIWVPKLVTRFSHRNQILSGYRLGLHVNPKSPIRPVFQFEALLKRIPLLNAFDTFFNVFEWAEGNATTKESIYASCFFNTKRLPFNGPTFAPFVKAHFSRGVLLAPLDNTQVILWKLRLA